MTAATSSLTGASLAEDFDWESISWVRVRKEVRRIQVRIAKAVRENRYGKAKVPEQSAYQTPHH